MAAQGGGVSIKNDLRETESVHRLVMKDVLSNIRDEIDASIMQNLDRQYLWIWRAGEKPERVLKSDVSYVDKLPEGGENEEIQDRNGRHDTGS